ncbi:tyrosine-type recombinase/integrase [Pseudorhizobium pelagicum]|nr:tyrosine-type recombinase/integrase [Pseudorhizobium pelagicum]
MANATLCEQFSYNKLPQASEAMSGTIIPGSSRTFRDAALSYTTYGGEQRYLDKILPFIGDRPLGSIVPFDIRQLAELLYPDAGNATRNRQVITPVRAVMHHAYDRGWAPLVRLRNLKAEAPLRKKAATPAWLHAFTRQCEKDCLPHLAALVLFMSQTAARVSEAIAVTWSDLDLTMRKAILRKTKTGTNSVRFLTDQLVDRLHHMKGEASSDDRVFRYTSRFSVNERIKAVCLRAGISYKPSHTCGRHAFANNAMDLGLDIKSTMVAGDWKSPTVFLGTYVNPRNSGRVVADRFNLYQYNNEL